MTRRIKKEKRDNLVFTKHIKDRMEERRISKEEVKETLRHPDRQTRYLDASVKSYKEYSGTGRIKKRLAVVWKRNGNQIILETAYWDYYSN